VTGAASGIGLATRELLESRGERVIGVDRAGSEVTVDLATPGGRAEMVREVTRLSGGRVDAILAVAGIAGPIPETVSVNYFGMVSTIAGLRTILVDGGRAVGVASRAILYPVDSVLVDLMLGGEEERAVERAQDLVADERGGLIYSSTKLAFSRWIRRVAGTADWAGSGIALNAIAPGVVRTGITAPMLATPKGTAALTNSAPMPLNGFADASSPASLLAWLASADNTHVCGQVVFIDGGSELMLRGESPW